MYFEGSVRFFCGLANSLRSFSTVRQPSMSSFAFFWKPYFSANITS